WVEYAGGYSDMLAQRGKGVRPPDVPQPKSRAPDRGADTSTTARRKLSFKEKHALETLPGTIARLEAEVAALSGKIADPGLYARDAAAFNAATARLAAAEAELSAAEEQWLELELLREELGQ